MLHQEFSFFLNIKIKKGSSIFFWKKYQTIFSKFFTKMSAFFNEICFSGLSSYEKRGFIDQTKPKKSNINFWKNSKCFKFKDFENKSLLSNKLRKGNLKKNLTYQLKKIVFFWFRSTKKYMVMEKSDFILCIIEKKLEDLIFFKNKNEKGIEVSSKIW